MAIKSTPPFEVEVEVEASSKILKCQTWVLKVSIHCQGCKKRVKKVLQGINGVYTTSIDPEQQKVTVTGNIKVETLIKKLLEKGKHAEVWKDYNAATGKDRHEKAKPATKNDTSTSKNKSTTDQPMLGTVKLCGEAKTGGDEHGRNRKQLQSSKSSTTSEEEEKKGSERETRCANEGKTQHSSSGATGSNGSFLLQCTSDHPSLSLAYQQQQLISPQGLNFFPVVGYTNNVGAFFYVQPSSAGYNHIPMSMTRMDSPLHIFSDENVNSCSIM